MSERESPESSGTGDGHDGKDDGGQPGESHKERVDRELIEFLNEVRVVLPGVQVLFAFLLTIPFTGRFASLTHDHRLAYQIAFYAVALAAVLMISPTALHRLRFRKGDKEYILQASNRLVLLGLFALAVGMVATIWLVSELLFDQGPANIVALVAAVVVGGLWFVLPMSRKFAGRQ
jgi:Family of unknown function (DUF6328)